MGRHYSGDINGEFWLGVQSSNDADSFGVIGCAPDYLHYKFNTNNLESVQDGIDKCLDELGDKLELLDDFFGRDNGCTDEKLMEFLEIEDWFEYRNVMRIYARLVLGRKIIECIKKTDECCFEAEL